MPDTKPRIPPWIAAVLVPVISGALGGGGAYGVMEWRLSSLEDTVKEATSRQVSEDFGALKQRVAALEDEQASEANQWRVISAAKDDVTAIKAQLRQWEQRLSDDTFGDWTGWRHTTDARLTGHDVDIRDLQRER